MNDKATPRERRSARTVQAILDAGREIIASEGIRGLSMRALAEAIDYSPAALYKYYDSKEEIIAALCSVGFELLHHHLVRALPGNASATEALFECGKAYLDFAHRHPEYYDLMFKTPPSEPPTASMEGLEQDSAFGVLLGIIRRGVETGEFHAREGYGPTEMAMHCWVTVHGIAGLTLTQMQGADEALKPTTEAILHALGRSLGSG